MGVTVRSATCDSKGDQHDLKDMRALTTVWVVVFNAPWWARKAAMPIVLNHGCTLCHVNFLENGFGRFSIPALAGVEKALCRTSVQFHTSLDLGIAYQQSCAGEVSSVLTRRRYWWFPRVTAVALTTWS